VVRRVVGYDRYEGGSARAAVNALYRDLRLYVNFFQPSVKLVEKARVDGRVKKVYDIAQTPYRRMLASPFVSDTVKARLTAQYQSLNPVALRTRILHQLDELWNIYAIRLSYDRRVHDGKIIA